MKVDCDLIDYDYIDYIKKQWGNKNLKYIVLSSRISFYNFRVDSPPMDVYVLQTEEIIG